MTGILDTSFLFALTDQSDRNDETLERIYIGRRFKNESDRVALRSKSP